MTNTSSDQTLMALLALESEDPFVAPDEATPTQGRRMASLPTLQQRTEMFLNAVYGPESSISAEVRSAARDHLLAAMAADLAEKTTSRPLARHNHTVPLLRSIVAEGRIAMSHGLFQLWAMLVRSLRKSASVAAETLTVRGLRMAAVPLIVLLVIGSVWTGNWMNYGARPGAENQVSNLPTNNGLTENAPRTRSLAPSSQAPERVLDHDLERAIAAEEGALGPTDPAVARKLVELASLFRSQGRYEEAETLCRRALAIQQRTLGPKHPETVRTVEELVAVYRLQGRTKEADDLLPRDKQP
jgi:tetratricopeptide (TPR) repeat protein